ncbi:MAG: NADH-quinone oxidoreductase subunit I [Cyanobacteriota bacterium]
MHPIMKLINKLCDTGQDTIFQPVTEICRGLATVFVHALRPPVTLEYPEVMPDLSPRFRGRLALLRKEDGNEMCTGCQMCSKVCPCLDLIQIQTSKIETPEGKKKIIVDNYTIDLGRCIFCGNCTDVCKPSCLVFIDDFELADYSRESLVFTKDMLLLSTEESNLWRKKHGKG